MFAVLVSVIFIPHLSVFYLFSPFSFFPLSLSRSKVSDPDKHTQFSPVTSQILPASLPSCSQSKHSFSSLKLNLTSLPYRLQSETFFLVVCLRKHLSGVIASVPSRSSLLLSGTCFIPGKGSSKLQDVTTAQAQVGRTLQEVTTGFQN